MALHEFHRRVEQQLAHPLAYPALPRRPHGQVLLRVWQHPSFTPAACWALIRDGKQEVLRRIVVDVAPDPLWQPISWGAEREVLPSEFADLMAQLRDLRFSPFQAREGFCLDGCEFGVDTSDSFTQSSLSWRNEPPETWQALAQWHARAIRQFNAVLPATSVPLSLPDVDEP